MHRHQGHKTHKDKKSNKRGGHGTSQTGGGLASHSGFIYGPFVLANVPIQAIGTLNTGELVYMIYNDTYTKMVSASGVAKYYKGSIDQFRPEGWNGYSDAGNNYILASALMTGWAIGNGKVPIPVSTTKVLPNGDLVYIVYDAPFTKMVSDKGEARYYTGPISQFDINSWSTYNNAGDGYKLYMSPVVPLNLQNSPLVQGCLYGPYINFNISGISISAYRLLANGDTVYLIFEGGLTKMVSSSGVAKYYNGQISDFKREMWDTYNDVGKNYLVYPASVLLRKNAAAPPAPEPNTLVTKDLVCYLDARRPDSLSNGSTQWKDLSGLAHHFNFKTPLVSDDFQADINTGGVGTGPSCSDLRLGSNYNNGSYSLVIVAKQKIFNGHFAFYIESKQGGRGISCHICWNDGNVYFDNMTCCNQYSNRIYYTMPDKGFKEHMYVLTRTSDGGLDIYVDSKLVAQGTRGVAQMPDLTGPAYINQTNNWNATMKLLLIYNRGLTSAEVTAIHGWYNVTCATYKKTLYDSWQSVTDKTLSNLKPLKLNRGLLLALDASDKACYNGGSQVNDLSGRGQVFTFLNGAPTVKNGAWQLDGNNTLKGPPSSRLGLDTGDYTIVYRCKVNKVSNNLLFILFGDCGCWNRALGIFPNWIGDMFYDQAGCYGDGQRLALPKVTGSDKMATYVLLKSSAGRAIYVNGTLMAKTPNRGEDIVCNSVPMRFFSGSDTLAVGNGLFFGEMSHFYIYDYALNTDQIKDIVQYCDNPYVVKSSSWAQAQLNCSRTGAILADSDNICYNGMAFSNTKYPNALVPIGGQPGMWMNISTCKPEKKSADEVVYGAHVKCMSLKRQKKYFSAVCSLGKTVLFFKGDHVLEYDVSTHTSKDPVSIRKLFPNIHKSLYSDIDACCKTSRSIAFFKGGLLGATEGAPGPLKFLYNLPDGFESPDAVDFDEKAGIVTIYKGNTCYACKAMSTEACVASKINFPNKIFSSGIDGIINVDGTKYIFREQYVYNVNTQELSLITDTWTGLRPPFVSVKKRCHIVSNLMSQLSKKIEETRGTNPTGAREYTLQLDALKKESSSLCEYRTMYEYKLVKDSQREKIADIDKSLRRYRDVGSLEEIQGELRRTSTTKTKLEKELELEKMRQCPTDAQCKGTDKKVEACNQPTIKSVLKKHGYSTDMASVSYDIKTHKDFWKYSKITDVKQCPKASSANVGANVGANAGKRKKKRGATAAERETYRILQDSVSQYYART